MSQRCKVSIRNYDGTNVYAEVSVDGAFIPRVGEQVVANEVVYDVKHVVWEMDAQKVVLWTKVPNAQRRLIAPVRKT